MIKLEGVRLPFQLPTTNRNAMKQMKDHLMLFSLLAAGLLTGCSADDPAESDTTSQEAIRMMVNNDWQAATRAASIYEKDSQLTSFRVTAYKDGTDVKYIDDELVNKDGENEWNFAKGKNSYYWPMFDALDFSAYMPSDLTNAVVAAENVGYVPGSGPTFTVSLPATSEGQDDKIEYVYAYVTGQTKDNALQGVKLDFHHPFASIRFTLKAKNDAVTINSLTIKDVMTAGSFSHGATPQWSSLGGAADFVATVNKTFEQKDEVQNVTGPYLVVPQAFADNKQTIVINYSDAGVSDVQELEITDPQWQAGNIYTYQLTIDTYFKVTVTKIDINPWQKYDWN